jgi:hypothetical protein
MLKIMTTRYRIAGVVRRFVYYRQLGFFRLSSELVMLKGRLCASREGRTGRKRARLSDSSARRVWL